MFSIIFGLMLPPAQGLRVTDSSCFELHEVIDDDMHVLACPHTQQSKQNFSLVFLDISHPLSIASPTTCARESIRLN